MRCACGAGVKVQWTQRGGWGHSDPSTMKVVVHRPYIIVWSHEAMVFFVDGLNRSGVRSQQTINDEAG